MKIARRNLWLGALAAVLLGAELYVQRPWQAHSARGPLFPDYLPELARGIRIEEDGEEPVELIRAEGGWFVSSCDGFPARSYAVDELLLRLGGVGPGELVSSRPDARGSYGLDEDAVRIQVEGAGGRKLVDLWQGAPEELREGSYIRPEGSASVYRAVALRRVFARAKGWLDTRWVELDPGRVQSVGCRADDATFDIELAEDGRWGSGSSSLAPAPVQALLRILSTAVFSEVRGRVAGEPAWSSPRLHLSLGTGGGEPIELSVLRAESGRVLATNGSWASDWVVELPHATLERLEESLGRIQAEL